MADKVKQYSNGDITIVWKPEQCIHSTRCWKGENGLRSVFNPAEKPWIKPDAAPTNDIILHIKNCPSGALSYFNNKDVAAEQATSKVDNQPQIIEVTPKGPLLIHGNIKVKHTDGSFHDKNNVTAFCRCGLSLNKPYCDGAHQKGFDG